MGNAPITAYGALFVEDPARCTFAGGNQHAMLGLADGSVRELSNFLTELPSGGFWWTNLTAQQMRETGLGHRNDLAEAGYLPTWPRSVLGELGKLDASPAEQVGLLGRVFSAVMTQVRDYLGLPDVAAGKTLPLALRRHYLREQTPDWNRDVQFAIESACQDFTSNSHRQYSKQHQVVLRYHRQNYATAMLSAKIPSGVWRELIAPENPRLATAWVQNMVQERPMLLRVTALQWHGERSMERAQAAALGSGAGAIHAVRGRTANLRSWVSAPEYMALAPLCDMQIHGVFAADGYKTNPLDTCIAPVHIGNGPSESTRAAGPFRLYGEAVVNYTTGLLCEAFWQSLTRLPNGRKDDAAVWMLATDRTLCLRAAMQIIDLGLPVEVTGFSRGRIVVSMDAATLSQEDIHLITSKIVSATGLLPPALTPPAAEGSTRSVLANEIMDRWRDDPEPLRRDPNLFLAAMHVFGAPPLMGRVL